MDCWVWAQLPLEVIAEPFGVMVSSVISDPPSKGEIWFKEICSIKDVPYFLKYHHSNICNAKKKNNNKKAVLHYKII